MTCSTPHADQARSINLHPSRHRLYPSLESQMGDAMPQSTVLPPPIPTLGTSTSPLKPSVDIHAPHLPDREWEKSPIYLALSSRLLKTEQTVSSLSTQVASLAQTVKTLSTQSFAGGIPNHRPPAVFSPFEGPDPALQTPFGPTPTNANAANGTDSTVAALTAQISALSTSVAQLQRLQQSQSHISRNNSYTQVGLSHAPRENHQPPSFHRQHTDIPQSQSIHGALVSPAISSSTGFGGRPGMGRSVSSNVVASGPMALTTNGVDEPHGNGNGNGNGGGNKWGAPKFPNGAGGGGRDWSPGPGGLGPLTPGGAGGQGRGTGQTPGPGGQRAGQGGANGTATPGGGIVAPKWEHFNLKPELLMGITKYG